MTRPQVVGGDSRRRLAGQLTPSATGVASYIGWIACFLSALCLASRPATAQEAKRPNVLFLLADDLRADAIAALGNSHIRTPHLDSLVNSGFAFQNAYCLGSNRGAVCLPSRNMLLSGRAYFRFKDQASGSEPNFPLSMRQAGYVTYHHGKRGNTAIDIQKQFEVNRYVEDQKERTSGQPGKAIVDAAISFLKQDSGGRPFFMYLAFEAPHDPRVAADEYLRLYDRSKIPLPKNYLPVHPFDNGEMTVRDEQLAPWPRTEDEIRRHLHEYYAVVSALDRHIGRLLQALKDIGKFDNTLIVFSSDHGLAIGSHGLMGKQSLYEHSMKSPLIFTGPGIPRGRSQALVYLLDIFPTVCELAQITVPSNLDGQSLAPVLTGQKEAPRDCLFTAYRDVQRSIRDDRWKLIRYPLINRTQLFDLQQDPDELHNLAEDSRYAEQVEQLLSRMRQSQAQLGDAAPLSSAAPQSPVFTPPAGKPSR